MPLPIFKTLYLSLGSNKGDKVNNLEKSCELISERMGQITRLSAFYETQAWGKTDQDDFVNQVAEIQTSLSPQEVLEQIFYIEKSLGRAREEKWGPRIIDLDILYYSNEKIIEKDLTIPHPEIQNRNFVLIPLVEIAPNIVHPVFNKTNKELLDICSDSQSVTKL